MPVWRTAESDTSEMYIARHAGGGPR